MKVYSVRSDVEEFQWIMPIEADQKAFWHYTGDLDCQRWEKTWRPLEFYAHNPRKRRGSFSYAAPNVLAFEPEVLDVMLDLLEWSGEILDIRCDGREMKLLNVLDCINCLDSEHSRFRLTNSGVKTGVSEYAFFKNRFAETPLFKIPETSLVQILTVSGLKHPDDEFFSRYQAHGLTGLVFKELWTDGVELDFSDE